MTARSPGRQASLSIYTGALPRVDGAGSNVHTLPPDPLSFTLAGGRRVALEWLHQYPTRCGRARSRWNARRAVMIAETTEQDEAKVLMALKALGVMQAHANDASPDAIPWTTAATSAEPRGVVLPFRPRTPLPA